MISHSVAAQARGTAVDPVEVIGDRLTRMPYATLPTKVVAVVKCILLDTQSTTLASSTPRRRAVRLGSVERALAERRIAPARMVSWNVIDRAEVSHDRSRNSPRVKISGRNELLAIAGSAHDCHRRGTEVGVASVALHALGSLGK